MLVELKPHTKGMWKSSVAAKKLLQYGTYLRTTEADVGLNTYEMNKKKKTDKIVAKFEC